MGGQERSDLKSLVRGLRLNLWTSGSQRESVQGNDRVKLWQTHQRIVGRKALVPGLRENLSAV